MNRKRVIETNEGIQSEITAAEFDAFQRSFRDKGLLETKHIIASGIDFGTAVEIGPGPGYLGLEWLEATEGTNLIGIEISSAMLKIAEQNRSDYNLGNRAEYRIGTALELPLAENSVEHVFSNGSLHEWEDPDAVLSEIHRVLKSGGRFFLSDLKRDMNSFILFLMKLLTKGHAMKKGLISSLRAAYTKHELAVLLDSSPFNACKIKASPFGIEITGKKE